MKPRYTDAFWGEHPFDGDMILIKNKNKNKYLQLVRSRIETLNTVFKRHGMFKKGAIFRGHVVNLAVFVKITAHGTAVELRERQQLRGPRHTGFGWWAHF